MTNNHAPGALDGIKVIDLSRILAGPWATQVLADLGAEVIKIEAPEGGDGTRAWGPPFVSGESGDAAYFMSCNRNKRSVAIDFSTPQGADLVKQLVQGADVVVQNFKVGGLKKYGLDAETLCALNPRLVYCSISGFGSTGPYAQRPGYDFLIQAMGGLMSVTGVPDGQPGAAPMKTGVAICDLFTGLYAANAVQAALLHRERHGEGQHIDCSLLDTQIAMLANQASNWLVGQQVPTRLGNEHPNIVPYKAYEVADGHLIIAVGNDAQFQRLCNALALQDLPTDQRFATNPGRVKNRTALDRALEPALKDWKRDALLLELERANVPAGPIRAVNEVFEDEHIEARHLRVEQQRPSGESIPTVGFPVQLSRTPATYRHAPPALGEATEEVLANELQLSAEAIKSLQDTGVVG